MTARPEILRGVKGQCEVRFHYVTKDGESAYISGHFQRALGSEEAGITGIEVKLGASSTLPGKAPGDLAKFAVDRITPGESGLIVPVSKKEMARGTGAAAAIAPTEKQIAYALSLCDRDGQAGGGNFYRPSAAEFRRMSRTEISEWIDTAKFELGI